MTQKEFDERIKRVMSEAKQSGWGVDQIEDYATEAIMQWVEEEYERKRAEG